MKNEVVNQSTKKCNSKDISSHNFFQIWRGSLNFRLQEIMGNTLFMGGISVVTVGDFGQLPPVGQNLIWEISHLDNRIEMCPNHWNENFLIYYLDEKMRSQDSEFSKISDLVRKGSHDDAVIEYMRSMQRESYL